MIRLCVYIVTVMIGVSCSSIVAADPIAIEGEHYSIKTTDRFYNYRFDIEFLSYSDKAICLHTDQWPSVDTYGQHRVHGEIIRGLDAEIEVTSNTDMYLPRQSNVSNDCKLNMESDFMEKCSIKIMPKQKIKTTLPYQYFSKELTKDPDRSKKLVYKVNALFCDDF